MVKKIKPLLFISFISLIVSCAQVVAPTGGEPDRTPPSVLSLSPENQSLNFSASSFTLEFDEYVVLINLKEQLLVSPPLKYSLENKIKGKKLTFTIRDTLTENTTYVFNFGNAIVDLNEGNPLENFQYVFSTGPVIDSLTLSGRVVDAFELTAEKEAVLLLYPATSEDSAISKQLPTYVSRANEEGSFYFTNLAAGDYKLYSLVDKNDNYLYDRPDEKIGFLSNLVNPVDSQKKVQLFSFSLPDTNQFIENQKVQENALELTFKIKPENVALQLIDTTIENFVQYTETKENKLTIWHKETSATKLKLEVRQGSFSDTVKFTPSMLNDSLTLELTNKLQGKQNFFEPIQLSFNRPLRAILTDSISILDSDSNRVEFTVTVDTINSKSAMLSIANSEATNLLLSILPNAFEDIYGKSNDSISIGLFFNTPDDFGNLLVKIKELNEQNLILQLTNSKGEILKEYFTTDTLYTFNHLPAAKYGLKLIADENNNGKWDSGNLYEKRHPERVIIYNEPIDIRQNWDKEIIWILKQ